MCSEKFKFICRGLSKWIKCSCYAVETFPFNWTKWNHHSICSLSDTFAGCENSLAIVRRKWHRPPRFPYGFKNAKFHGAVHAEIMVNAASQKRTGLYRSEECNIRLKEICYQRDCERIVILANQESILVNYREGRGERKQFVIQGVLDLWRYCRVEKQKAKKVTITLYMNLLLISDIELIKR